MTSIKDLKEGDWVQFMCDNQQTQYGEIELFVEDMISNVLGAKLKLPNGQTYMLKDDDDFVKVDPPFNFKVDNVHQPSHYTYGDIEVIDFIEQVTKEYPPELAFSLGNVIKYISRANHKNGKEDLDKARWYLNRVFEKWEDK
ncbi:DUF3310 domain-containing protein [Staphylococcus devriesei]|uniref:DUF3310 domain-containing protein n=1 Tax=Staphylococcus devriesei TaxID=586733 RepID=UPI002676D855|nr:DUF3310 domain-containing protein [Staphylococcus devriesei]WKU13018.1 DUF3310 domain-containing protein [Staphylococcus devriesei]